MATISLAEQSRVRRLTPFAMPVILTLLAAAVAFSAIREYYRPVAFRNPIAYTMVGDSLYVLEKKRNTLLQFDHCRIGAALKASGSYRIEPDDAHFYYMVRKLYPGPTGLVVHSYIYDRKTRGFLGYRFQEYVSFRKRPQPLLTVFLKDTSVYPEIRYACDRDGNHYFLNNIPSSRNIWKMPASAANIEIKGGIMPPAIQELGDRNDALSGWPSLCIGSDNHIFVSSSAAGRIVEYDPDGRKLREIGTVGFNQGELLAPDEVFFFPITPDKPAYLTVASSGNRSWVQFDPSGAVARVISPLQAGYPYPDMLVGHVYIHLATAEPAKTGQFTGEICSFDLVNKCLVLLGRQVSILPSYRILQIGQTCWLAGAVLLLLLLAITWRRLMILLIRLKIPFFIKLLGLFIPLLIISLLVAGDWVGDIMQADLEAESIRRSANLSQAILNSVSLADLEAIREPQDRGGLAYERVYAVASRIVDAKRVAYTPKWIIHKVRDGRFYFGISVWRGPLYEPFIVPHERQMFFRVLREKTSQAGRFFDEQGEWFSVLNPILNAAGEVIYVLELYRPTEEIDRANREAMHKVIAITGVTALAAIVLVLLFSYIFTRPLRQLMLATERLGRGDFDHPIIVRSRDELRDLAAAFNHMMVDLKRYIADLARSTAEREKIQGELRFAREVQQGIVPKVFPPFPQAPNVEIVARMEPAREVGGDYFDFFMIDPDHMGVVIADVSDKGVPAGLFTMIVRTLLRVNAKGNLSAADTVSRMNRQIAADNPSCMFVTLFYFVCDLRTGVITFCNAGHPPPICLKQDKADMLTTAEGRGGCVIAGIYDNVEYSEGELVLAEGDTLVLYTDGVTEPINKAEQMYGEERLRRVLIEDPRRTNRQRCDRVVADVMDHQKGIEQFDDITILFFKFLSLRPGDSAPRIPAPFENNVAESQPEPAAPVQETVEQRSAPPEKLDRGLDNKSCAVKPAVPVPDSHARDVFTLTAEIGAPAEVNRDENALSPGGVGQARGINSPEKKSRRRNPSHQAEPYPGELWLPGLQ